MKTNITLEATGKFKVWAGDDRTMRPITPQTFDTQDEAIEFLNDWETQNGYPISEWIEKSN